MNTKNKDAPFECKTRINHPLFTSRQMWMTLSNAIKVLAAKCIAKNSPVMIWIPSINPKRDPKFQKILILEGVGRLISEE